MMPVVYRKGDLSGMDILILRDLKLYCPAIDGWINLVATSGAQDLGELMPKQGKGKSPSQVMLRLKEFPYMIKTARSQLTGPEFAALSESLYYPDEEVAGKAFRTDLTADFLLRHAHAAAMVAHAAAASPAFRETFCRNHGDETLALVMKKAESYGAEPCALLRKASSAQVQKLAVIRDIADPRAQALKPSEKRILLKHGQFVVDHRADTETSIVYRSPEGQMFQTVPGAGRWRLLTSTGDLIHVETALPEDTCNSPFGAPSSALTTLPPPEVNPDTSDVWVIPADGSKPFRHMRKELYVRPATIPQEDWPLKGVSATKPAVRQLLLDKEAKDRAASEKAKTAGGPQPGTAYHPDTLYGTVMIVGNGRAFRASLNVPRVEDNAPLVSDGKQIIFTGTPGKIRILEDRMMVPSSARLFLDDYGSDQSISLGRPSDLTGRIIREEGAKELAVRLSGPLYDMTGAVNKMARPENDALLDLVQEAGIQASVAAGILRDAAQRAGETHRYLVKQAFAPFSSEEEGALSTLHMAPPTQQLQSYADPAQLAQQGRQVAGATQGQPDDVADRKMMEEVMNMTSFREINSDMVRQCTSTMNEMGQLLLRVLLHTDEYENRFGQDDAERLKLKCRDTFFNDGDMALFLREKRGSGGIRDDEGALADLLSADMGGAGGGTGAGVGAV
jgi:hypothetical protein